MLAEPLARARVAVLDLAPGEDPETGPEPPAAALARALAVIAELRSILESGDDTLRALLAADMELAVGALGSATSAQRGRVVALVAQALSVLADDPPRDEPGGSLPSRSPLALANELRALSGAPLLSGNAVFAVAVNAGAAPARGEGDDRDPVPRLAATARRLRPYYQQGLVAWLRGDASPKAAAERIGAVFARLHALSQGTPSESLWRAASSFASLLKDPRWRASGAVKRLLGQLDGRLKRLGAGNVPAADEDAVLAQDLLFYLRDASFCKAVLLRVRQLLGPHLRTWPW